MTKEEKIAELKGYIEDLEKSLLNDALKVDYRGGRSVTYKSAADIHRNIAYFKAKLERIKKRGNGLGSVTFGYRSLP